MSDLHNYLIALDQANSGEYNKKICNKNCDKARTCVELGYKKEKEIHFPKHRVFYSLEYRTMEKVPTPSNSERYTPLSEPFGIQ
jgi:hypothetical protein